VYLAQHIHESASTTFRATEKPGSQDQLSHLVAEVLAVLRQHEDFGETAAINWARSRLSQLRSGGNIGPKDLGCIRVLEFVVRHSDQVFDFEHFLRCRAG
jgi:hypothetical protein